MKTIFGDPDCSFIHCFQEKFYLKEILRKLEEMKVLLSIYVTEDIVRPRLYNIFDVSIITEMHEW